MFGENMTHSKSIEMFTEELKMYEAVVKANSNHFADYKKPAELMKNALWRLVSSNETDTLSMMRRLVAHINGSIDDNYSDFTITMLSSSTHDERARQLIMNVLYVTREVVIGDEVRLTESWLQLVDRNLTIAAFLKNYARSDQAIVEESYSGNVVSGAKYTEKVTTSDSPYTLMIGYNNYALALENNTPQKISFGIDPIVKYGPESDTSQNMVIVTEVKITPVINHLVLDKSIHFFDDALAQIRALRCSPAGYMKGQDTTIILPDMFYSLALNVMSSDSGVTWRITEINILPPSLS